MLQSLPGKPIPNSYDAVVTVLFVALLYTGARFIIEKAKGGRTSQAGSPHIEGDYNTYINLVAKTLNVSEPGVTEAIRKAVGKTRQPILARAAIDIFRPAKRGGDGRIHPLNAPPISRDTVAEFPTDLVLAELERDTVPIPIPDARVRIRATDRDKSDKGWAGIILNGDFTSKRLPLVLSPEVDPNELAKCDEVDVEAVLESKLLEDGRTKPYRIHIMRILA